MRWLLCVVCALCIHGALAQTTEADRTPESDILKADPGNARALLGRKGGPTPPPTPPPALSGRRRRRTGRRKRRTAPSKTPNTPPPTPLLTTPPSTPLQCPSPSLLRSGADAKVVKLTQQNFRVHSKCTKFGALPSNPTCPEGYCVTPGTLVNKRVYKYGTCVSVQTVLCQCGSSDCPTASCKTYTPSVYPLTGHLNGFRADNGALYKANSTAWSHVNTSAHVERKVISMIDEWTQDFMKIRAAKIAACSKSIEEDNSTTGAVGTYMTGHCPEYNDQTKRFQANKKNGSTYNDLACCAMPWQYKMQPKTVQPTGYNGNPIPGSHQWPDTPTRCTLDNPLVQAFYSNMGPRQTRFSGRITMPGRVDPKLAKLELAQVNKFVKSAMETAFPGEEVATNISSVKTSYRNYFAIVIGAGQRNAAGRRLLGGPGNNVKLNGKHLGSYGCEVKYQAMISLGRGSNRCSNNARGGHLCEPEMAASLHLWMVAASTMARARSPMAEMVLLSGEKLYRPNNTATTCARVDAALRLALAKYRLDIKASGRLKVYQDATKLEQTRLGEGPWSFVQTRTGTQHTHRCVAHSVSRNGANAACRLDGIDKGIHKQRVAEMVNHQWVWNAGVWNHRGVVQSNDRRMSD